MTASRRVKTVSRILNLGGRIRPLGTAFGRVHAALLRASGGRLFPRFAEGMPVMVLETVGRKSARVRRTPVLRFEHDGRLIVIPANAGSDRAPAWFHNLMAAGEAVVYVGREARRVRPRVADPDERARLWLELAKTYRGLDEYTRYTAREIPIVFLEPLAPTDG
jgi:F420H(2)-dependent quinone reductase